MKERSEVIGKDLKVFLHFDLGAHRVVQLDQAREDEKCAYEKAGELVDYFLHNSILKGLRASSFWFSGISG